MKCISTLLVSSMISLHLFSQPAFEWAKQIGGTDYDAARAITNDEDGNIYVAGNFSGTADFDPDTGVHNMMTPNAAMFICKLDNSGNFIWAKQFDTGNFISANISSIVARHQGVYISGYFQDSIDLDPGPANYTLTSAGNFDVFILKLDTAGNFVWGGKTGGTGDDIASGISVDTMDNIYSTGRFTLTADFDPGPGVYNMTSLTGWQTFILKLNALGNFAWAKKFTGNAQNQGRCLINDSNGNVYISGDFNDTVDFDPGAMAFYLSSAGNKDIFISKLDSSGNFVNANRMGGIGDEAAYSSCLDHNNNILTTGFYSATADFDPGASAYLLTSSGYRDIFISKLTSSFNFEWAKSVGGAFSDDNAYSIAAHNNGSLLITGDFRYTADFDPGLNYFGLTSDGLRDAYICELDSSGNFVLASRMGGTDTDYGLSVAIDKDGNLFGCGIFEDSAHFNPSSGTFDLISAGGYEAFIVKWHDSTSGINDPAIYDAFIIYPNPASKEIIIKNNRFEIKNVKLYDVTGRITYENNIYSKEIIINVSELNAGIYFVKVFDGEKYYCRKIIVKQN